MYKKIYKYTLEFKDTQNISLPVKSKILTIQNQNEVPCLWALVDPNEKQTECRNIEIFGTGHNIGYECSVSRNYISTVQFKKGDLAYHFFEYTGV